MKWADYCVSKLNLDEHGMIDTILYCEDMGNTLDSTFYEKNRSWMVQKVSNGNSFCSIKKNDEGLWNKIGDFTYKNGLFSWFIVPKNITRRKTFISYYHKEDQYYKEKFKALFDDLIVNKSVEYNDIDSDNSDGYIKQLIQKGYLADTTVLVVLIGKNTKHRMHIDWEISGVLNVKVGEKYSGLLGIILPDHPDFGTKKARFNLMPARLADNFKSGYALIRDWTDDRVKMQEYIELAFEQRTSKATERVNSRTQMQENTN